MKQILRILKIFKDRLNEQDSIIEDLADELSATQKILHDFIKRADNKE